MTGVTVASVRRQIAASETAQRMQALAALDDRRRAAVLDMLAGLRPTATVDIDALLRAAGARAGAEAMGLTDEEREHVRASLDRLRTEATARGIAPGDPAMYGLLLEMQSDAAPATTTATADAEPDPDIDDDDAADAPRTPLRRVRLRRHRRVAPGDGSRPSAPPAAPRTFLGGRVLGGAGDPARPFGCSVDYDSSAWVPRPPWLLDPGTDEHETEKDHVTASETRASA